MFRTSLGALGALVVPWRLALCLAGSLAGSLGCDAGPRVATSAETSGAVDPDTDADTADADADRTVLVREALRVEPGLSAFARLIRISTERGHVTLTGTVATPGEHDRVLTMVREIAGARHVTSQLVVADGGGGGRLSGW